MKYHSLTKLYAITYEISFIKQVNKTTMKQIERWLIALYIIVIYVAYEVNRLAEGNFFN